MYTLTIYYTSFVVHEVDGEVMQDDILKSIKPPGHFHVGLQGDGNAEKLFGLCKLEGLMLVGKKVPIIDRLVTFITYKRGNQDYTVAKQIQLTKQQYDKAYSCARFTSFIDTTGCFDFVQSIYNAAELPLHFTQIYSCEEISCLQDLASYQPSVYKNIDSVRPNCINVKGCLGLTKDKLASKLNIPVDRLEPVENEDLKHGSDELQTFQIDLNESDLLPKNLLKTIWFREESDAMSQNYQWPSTLPQQHERDDYNISELIKKLLLLNVDKWRKVEDKLNILNTKVAELQSKHYSAVNDALNDFIKDKNKILEATLQASHAENKSAMQQIYDSRQTYIHNLKVQKKAETHAECLYIFSEVIRDAILKRKMEEYKSLVYSRRNSDNVKIDNLMEKFKIECSDRRKATSDEILNKAEIIKMELKKFSEAVCSEQQSISAKIKQGDDVDIDAVMKNLNAQASVALKRAQLRL